MEVKSYDLSLDVNFHALTYKGRVTTALEGVKGDVRFNSLDLTIRSVTAGGKSLHWEAVPAEEEIVIHGVPAGETTLVLDFEGKVSDGTLVGLYRSRFDGGYILTTQFEATQARRLFPCIDHPAYKAVFRVDVAVEDGLGMIFNTPIDHVDSRADGKKVFRFQATPRMSTYLLYLGIGNFGEFERKDGNLRVIVAAPEEKRAMTGYALDHGGRTVRFFEDYFGIPYPLPKLHLIAVPDTWVGGMENWGAITFRELALLVDEHASASAKKTVVDVLAHEVAHQWFGDLVTMAWWNDIWLNESFATFMTHKAVDFLHPEWETWNSFLADDVARALLWDALRTTHAIESKVERPADIDEAFDDITYQKGSAVLKMIEAYVGEEEFRRGVATYLNRFQFGNASGSDLWHAIEEVTGVPVEKIMDGWIKRAGYPRVTLEAKGHELHLRQERFLLDGTEEAAPWPIPVTVKRGSRNHRVLLEGRSHAIPLPEGEGPIVANVGRSGFYRVHYAGKLQEDLLEHFAKLEEKDRWGLLQDAYASLLTGDASVESYLALIHRAASDSSWLVAMEAATELTNLLPIVPGPGKEMEAIAAFARHQLDRVGLTPRHGESDPTKTLRERLANLRVYADEAFGKEMAARWSGYDSADPDLKAAIAIARARNGGEAEHREIVDRFLNAPSEQEAQRMALALSGFTDAALLERSINLALDPQTGLGKGLTLIQVAMALATRTPAGRKVMWGWFTQNLDQLTAVTKGSSLLSLLVQYYLPRAGLGMEAEVRAFLEKKTIVGGEAGKAKGLELLGVYERLRRRL